jgi:hypothetical protein
MDYGSSPCYDSEIFRGMLNIDWLNDWGFDFGLFDPGASTFRSTKQSARHSWRTGHSQMITLYMMSGPP